MPEINFKVELVHMKHLEEKKYCNIFPRAAQSCLQAGGPLGPTQADI